MKSAVAARREPVYSGFEVFEESPLSQATYVMRGPFAEIGRNPSVHFPEFDSDASAAYQCALMWSITGDRHYADKSRQILTGWSTTLTTVSGADAVLMAGLGPFKMVNAAEILRYTDPGWTASDTSICENMFRRAIYLTLKDFAPFANGNWDTAAVKTVMAVAVFCDDRAMFERALRYYVGGAGDGRLTHYIDASGQCQESGRDQAHTLLGLGHLGDCCQIAWNQGLDLYGYAGDRLLKGFEYTAKYNLGIDVPFSPDIDWTGKYSHQVISTLGRGKFRPVYEQIYNHYSVLCGEAAPYTQQVVEKVRPEGAAPGADHAGFGTLLYGRSAESPPTIESSIPAAPGGLLVRGGATSLTMTWIKSIGATSYVVGRSDRIGGPYRQIAGRIRSAGCTDAKVHAGAQYYYAVWALNAAGRSAISYPAGAVAGLPARWSHCDIGPVAVPGDSVCDDGLFTLQGAGESISGTADTCQFASVRIVGDGVITARFVPQVSSQFSVFGLMMRSSLSAPSASVMLLISPQRSAGIEVPSWNASLLVRPSGGWQAAVCAVTPAIPSPTVTYGRLMRPYWLRLARSGATVTALISLDGRSWNELGSTPGLSTSIVLAGLAACSGLKSLTTSVMFDHVSVTGRLAR